MLKNTKLKVVVFYQRREDWLKQNKNIKEAEEKARFLQRDVEINELLNSFKIAGIELYEIQNKIDLINFIEKNKNNLDDFVAWNLTDGEDIFIGTHFASVARMLNIPILNCTSYVQALSQSKDAHLAIANHNGILVPKFVTIFDEYDLKQKELFKGPYMVKPSKLDNSAGIRDDSVVQKTWKGAINKASELLKAYETPIQIEEFICGKEITVPFVFLEGKWHFSVFEVKYDGLCQTIEVKEKRKKEVVQAPSKYKQDAIKITKNLIKCLNITSYGRMDFRLNKQNKLVLIEFNSGASQTGLAWQKAVSEWGYTFSEYLLALVRTKRRGKQ
jgi:D-alanine-D-alanine ligase-like ATP-grasp enzyme